MEDITQREIEKVADLIGNQWKELGVHLGIPYDQLDGAKAVLKGKPAAYMLQSWLDGKMPKEEPRAQLIKALQELDRRDIASAIGPQKIKAAEDQAEDFKDETEETRIFIIGRGGVGKILQQLLTATTSTMASPTALWDEDKPQQLVMKSSRYSLTRPLIHPIYYSSIDDSTIKVQLPLKDRKSGAVCRLDALVNAVALTDQRCILGVDPRDCHITYQGLTIDEYQSQVIEEYIKPTATPTALWDEDNPQQQQSATESKSQNVLNMHKAELVGTLDVHPVILQLLELGVIDPSMLYRFTPIVATQKKMERLLSHLEHEDPWDQLVPRQYRPTGRLPGSAECNAPTLPCSSDTADEYHPQGPVERDDSAQDMQSVVNTKVEPVQTSDAIETGTKTEKEVDGASVDRTLSKWERLAKAEELHSKICNYLLSMVHASGIDMDDQKVTIYCPADEVEAVQRDLQEQLSSVDTELHCYWKVVGAEFCMVRDQCGVRAGCHIQYEDQAGRRFNVTFGGLFENRANNKTYIMTTSHLTDARGRPFYYTCTSGEEVYLGYGVAFAQLRQPLIEACLVEVDQAVADRCHPCFSKSKPETPAVFRGPYTGPDKDLVPVDDEDVPTEVLMCTESMKKGRVKVINFCFRDPDTDPKDNIKITGGMVTVPVDGDDLAVPGHSGAFIGLASAHSFTVEDWCVGSIPMHQATAVKQVYGRDSITATLHRNALPMGEPSSNMQTTTVHIMGTSQPNPEAHVATSPQHPNPERYIDVKSPPTSLTSMSCPELNEQSVQAMSLVDRFIMGGKNDDTRGDATGSPTGCAVGGASFGAHDDNEGGAVGGAAGGANGGAHFNDIGGDFVGTDMRIISAGGATGDVHPTCVHSTPCNWRLAGQVSSHEAISMHCFGGPFPGHPERGSVSFRLDRTIKELQKQLHNADLVLIPILRSDTACFML